MHRPIASRCLEIKPSHPALLVVSMADAEAASQGSVSSSC